MNLSIKMLSFAIIGLMTACTTSSKKQPGISRLPDTAKSIIEGSSNMQVDNFAIVPKELAGCGCYFSETQKQFDEKHYIFASDFDSVAFISLSGQMVRLKLLSSTRKPGTFGDSDHTEVFSNGKYKVTVHIKYKKSLGEEVWWNDGFMIVESPEGKLSKTFVGECGC